MRPLTTVQFFIKAFGSGNRVPAIEKALVSFIDKEAPNSNIHNVGVMYDNKNGVYVKIVYIGYNQSTMIGKCFDWLRGSCKDFVKGYIAGSGKKYDCFILDYEPSPDPISYRYLGEIKTILI